MLKNIRVILLASVIAGLSLPALADQSSEDRMREQLRQTVMQLRQVEDENAELKNKAAAAPAAPVVVQPKVDKASRAELENARRSGAAQQQRADDLQKQLDDLKAQLAKVQADDAQALSVQVKAAQDAQARVDVVQAFADNDRTCLADNAMLVKINEALLKRYDERTPLDIFWRSEPVTGIPHIEVERLVQTYHAQVVDGVAPPAPAQ
jgi:uncharacterized coiled-coil protein SlyX